MTAATVSTMVDASGGTAVIQAVIATVEKPGTGQRIIPVHVGSTVRFVVYYP